MHEKQIKAFRCKACKKQIAVGLCGEHRIETNHKKFEEIFDIQELKGGLEKNAT